MLGGAKRDRLRACASTIYHSGDLDRIGAGVRRVPRSGLHASSRAAGATISTSPFGRDETRDMAIARTVRTAIGPDVDMICDVVALAGWTAEHAIHDGPPARRRGAGCSGSRTRSSSRTSTGTGSFARRSRRASAPARRAGPATTSVASSTRAPLDVIMIDPGKAEGVTGTWNVIRAAAAAGRDWNAHSWSSALNTAASLHLATASDNVL